MSQTNPSADVNDQRAEKARMLITILGNDFTRKSSHPFFRTLTETAANPDAPQKDQPDISRALRNLMSHLSSQEKGGGLATQIPSKTTGFSLDAYVSADQHPALIASSLAKLDAAKRRVILRSLNGPLACRVLVYLREIENRATASHS